MSRPAQQTLEAMYARLAPHFRALAHGRVPPLDDVLLQKIDLAINEVAACTATTHARVAAIVGLRRSLYPEAPPYRPGQMLPAPPQIAPSEVAGVT
jgi:hypothetical protein